MAGLRLGLVTDTQDTTGTALETHPVTVTAEQVRQVLERFRGPQQQIPPMYSAIKIGGQKLYDLARKGQEVERKPRSVIFYELELLEQVSETDFVLRCLCSKGTYIRTLCHDIGQALGCGGAMYSLRRTMAAAFTADQAVTLEDVQSRGKKFAAPTDSLFSDHPILLLKSDKLEKRVRCGNPITLPGTADGTYRVYTVRAGSSCAFPGGEGGVLTSIKNFFGHKHERESLPWASLTSPPGPPLCCGAPRRRPPAGAAPRRCSPLTARPRRWSPASPAP